jgi:hypothetical protein
MALLRGRERATAQDVYDVAYDILNARLALSYRALAEGFTIDDVLVELLTTVPAPGSNVRLPVPAPGRPAPTVSAAPGGLSVPAPSDATREARAREETEPYAVPAPPIVLPGDHAAGQ